MSKLISNYFYNTIYQVLVLVLPVITIPYLSRVIGPEGIGVSSYSLSIVQIFALFASVGIPLFGNRQIAAARNQGKEGLSKVFWSIFSIQIFFSIVVTIIYVFFVYLSVESHRPIYWAQLFIILSALVDITWLYIGLEELKKTVIRNTIVRIVSLLLIFILVKEPNDVLIYVYINSLTQFIGQLVLWFQLFDYIEPVKIKISDMTRQMKPLLIVFSSQIIIQIYIVVDRVLLGSIVNEEQVGFYDQASKIVKLTLGIITSLGTVMLPRIASEFAQGNYEKIKEYSRFTTQFILLTTMPMTAGLACIAHTLVPWFFGPGFEEVVNLIIIMSPIVVFIGLSNIFGIQILLPMEQQNKLTISVTIGAVASVIVNILLIRQLESTGTAIATLVAEGLVTLVQVFFVGKFIDLRALARNLFKYGLYAAIMGMIVWSIGYYFNKATIFVTAVQVAAGVLVYLGILFISKDRFFRLLIQKVLRRNYV